MCPSSEFQDKVDALDFVMNVLKEHERNLSELADRLEGFSKEFSKPPKRRSVALPRVLGEEKPGAVVQCVEWLDFKERSDGARLVTFEVGESVFSVKALCEGAVYGYSDSLPSVRLRVKRREGRSVVEEVSVGGFNDLFLLFKSRLGCGLPASVRSSRIDLSSEESVVQLSRGMNLDEAKRWLSRELNVSERDVIQGKMTHTN